MAKSIVDKYTTPTTPRTTPPTTPSPTPQPVKQEPSRLSKLFDPQAGTNRNLFETRGNIFQRGAQLFGDVISAGNYAYGGALKGLKQDVLKQRRTGQQPNLTTFDYGQRFKAGIEGAKRGLRERQGVAEVTQGGSFGKGTPLGVAYDLMSELSAPDTLDIIPIGKIADLAKSAKLGKFLEPVTKVASKVGDEALDFARKTPSIYKPIEAIAPAFRVPELGKLADASKLQTRRRINQVVSIIDDAAQGLTPTQRRRVGQLIEGGISADQNDPLLTIARRMNELTDSIGKEAVDAGLMTQEAFDNLKGRYLTHIWTNVDDPIESFNDFIKLSEQPKISGRYFKGRTGEEGYTRDFGAALTKGLGQEVKDIEAVNFYRKIADRFGVKAEGLKSPDSIVKEALDQLRKEYRPPKAGLGEGEQGAILSQDMGNYLLNVFDEYLPATKDVGEFVINKQGRRVYKKAPAMGTRAVLKGRTPQEIEKWVRGNVVKSGDKYSLLEQFPSISPRDDINSLVNDVVDLIKKDDVDVFNPKKASNFSGTESLSNWTKEQGAAFQKVFGFTPDESHLKTIISRVGELPGPKELKQRFGPQEITRILEEGFGYAPDEIKNQKIASLFEDVALPNEVIDYINKTSQVPPQTIFNKALNLWKQGKTLWNPAYHMRNVISNQLLSSMATGRGIERTVIDYISAVRRYADDNNDIVRIAKEVGLIKQEDFIDAFRRFADNAGELKKGNFERVGEFIQNVQQVSEETAKLNVFTSILQDEGIKAGKTIAETLADEKIVKKAFDAAETAIFSPYRIGAGERALVRNLIPFYSFTRQVVPFTLETAAKRPEVFTGLAKRKRFVESLSDNLVPKEDLPEYQRDDIQIPQGLANILGAEGKPTALDISYIMPTGPVTETGDFGLPFGLSGNPFLSELYQQELNKDPFFDKPIVTSELPGVGLDVFTSKPVRAGSQRLQHALNTLAPSLYRTLVSKVGPALLKQPDYAGRDRSIKMALLDVIGLKFSILKPEVNKKYEKKDKTATINKIKREIKYIKERPDLGDSMKEELINDYQQRLLQVQRGN